MSKEIKVFEPPMCCSSGMCGPVPDESVVNFNALTKKIEADGHKIKRFTLNQGAADFEAETQVMAVLEDEQLKALPMTVINGRIMKKGAYPTHEEILSWL